MKTTILLLAILFLSCKEKQNSVIVKATPAKSEAVKNFKPSDHLFLNYYFGMSVEDYEHATKVNFRQKKILLADDWSDCKLKLFNENHAQEDIESISRLSKIYYAFVEGGEEFEAIIKPQFKNNRLAKIELRTLDCFNVGDHNHGFYRQLVNNIHKKLLDHHKEKHGNYIKKKKNHSDQEITAYKDAGIAVDVFDSHLYVFNDKGKIISIEQKCCDFKPIITYAVDDSRLREIL